MPERLVDDVEVDGPGVVHVEADRLAVGHDEPGVTDRAVGGARNAMIMMSSDPLSPVTVVFTESVVSTNLWKPSRSSSRLRSGTG